MHILSLHSRLSRAYSWWFWYIFTFRSFALSQALGVLFLVRAKGGEQFCRCRGILQMQKLTHLAFLQAFIFEVYGIKNAWIKRKKNVPFWALGNWAYKHKQSQLEGMKFDIVRHREVSRKTPKCEWGPKD